MRVNCDPNGINNAISTIKKGGIVVFPTDTVYGIGCDPYNQNAVKTISTDKDCIIKFFNDTHLI